MSTLRQVLLRAAELTETIPVERDYTYARLEGDVSLVVNLANIDELVAQGKVLSACTLGYVMIAQGDAEIADFCRLWDLNHKRLALPFSYHDFAQTASREQMHDAFTRLAALA